jgi:hypothetical protein
MTGWTY